MPDPSSQKSVYGEPGSTRPDFYNPELGETREVKRYDIRDPELRESLIRNTAHLAAYRSGRLPEGTRQRFQLDFRGFGLAPVQIEGVVAQLVAEAGGALAEDDLIVVTD